MTQRSNHFLIFAFTCSFLLSGCETAADAKKAQTDPIQLHKTEAQTVASDVKAETFLPVPDASADKIAKLEQKVAALEKEVTSNRPKIAKIDVIEQKFKDLSLGLEKIDATYNMKPVMPPDSGVPPQPAHAILQPALAPLSSPVTPALTIPAAVTPPPVVPAAEVPKAPPVEVAPPKAPTPIAPTPIAKQPAVKKAEEPKTAPVVSDKKIISDLRLGEQKGFSRLVLDMSKTQKISYDIDNEEKILTIDIPGFTWTGPKTKTITNSPLVASYDAQSDAKGAHLMVQLKKAAKVSNSSTIDPTPGKAARAVLDIAAK